MHKNIKWFFLSLLTFQALAEPLTQKQFEAQKEFAEASKKEGWTFEYDVRQIDKWATGYVKKNIKGAIYALGENEKFKSIDLDSFQHEKTPTMDQKNCGSCVVFSFVWNFEEALRLRGVTIPSLSQQHLMNCGTGGQCNGAYGEEIAQDLVNLKTLHAAKDYPYTAKSGKCQVKTGPRYGQTKEYKTIDGSVKSILAALHNGQPVSVGIAADNKWSSYSGGIFNACGSTQVNHYVVIKNVDCGKSVDADGFCVLDAKGNLPAGVGTFGVQNSWGDSWGVNGQVVMSITDKNGKRCQNIAGMKGDAQVLDTGIPMPEDKPVTFTIENSNVSLTATVQTGSSYGVEAAKKALLNAINAVGE